MHISSMVGAAVELIRYNAQTHRFEVGADALDVLRSTTTPVGVVAVCGRARQVRGGRSTIYATTLGPRQKRCGVLHTNPAPLAAALGKPPQPARRAPPCPRPPQGKSFILNQLLSVTAGFQIGSTHRPCTKGLWMWSTPQARTDADGNPYHLVRAPRRRRARRRMRHA